MQQHIRIRGVEAPESKMGRELAEEELAAICGGTGSGTGTSNGLGNVAGFGSLGSAFGNLGGELGSQFNGLLGGGSTVPATTSPGATPASSSTSFPLLGGLL